MDVVATQERSRRGGHGAAAAPGSRARTATTIVLYVESQRRATDFYAQVLDREPSLDVPGMTEFDLGGATLGLMPVADLPELLPGVTAGRGPRCELSLRRADAGTVLRRIEVAGGRLLSPLSERTWGEHVGYALDLDGHVLAVAQA